MVWVAAFITMRRKSIDICDIKDGCAIKKMKLKAEMIAVVVLLFS